MNLADIQRQMNGTTTTSQTLSTVELITMPSFKVVANNPTYIEVLWFNETHFVLNNTESQRSRL